MPPQSSLLHPSFNKRHLDVLLDSMKGKPTRKHKAIVWYIGTDILVSAVVWYVCTEISVSAVLKKFLLTLLCCWGGGRGTCGLTPFGLFPFYLHVLR